MNVLLTCDDGYCSSGFKALQDVAKKLKLRATCVAPSENMSGVGSCRTLGTVLVRELQPRFLVISGTPVDCVNLALAPEIRRAFKLPKFDMVLSGINWGANVGVDNLECSGTYAAARYAALCGVPAMALSQDVRSGAKFQIGLATVAVKAFLLKNRKPNKLASPVVNLNLPCKPASYNWEKVKRYCLVDRDGGYYGSWKWRKDLGRSWVPVTWSQKWKPGLRGACTDASVLGMGDVTITAEWIPKPV